MPTYEHIVSSVPKAPNVVTSLRIPQPLYAEIQRAKAEASAEMGKNVSWNTMVCALIADSLGRL